MNVMRNKRDYSSIAFVSGKGGVGKTTLATNIAWLISTAPARVLIIDLDFQDLGCTGLFAARYHLGTSNALELVLAQEETNNSSLNLTQITENLQFLPAALILQTAEHYDAFLEVPEDIYERLDKLLNNLYELYSIDCFVLDCHGGIDATSIAAAGICDKTLIVTEADTVTFAGTLGLFDSYYHHYDSFDRRPMIEFIVNRIPPKYKWKDLDRLYRVYLERHLGELTKSKSVLSYISAEGYLADSFGDYPFQVELAPSAIFTRKLELILGSLFQSSNPKLLSKKVNKRFQKKRYANKIHKRIISNEARYTRNVFTSYGLFSFYLLFVIPYYSRLTLTGFGLPLFGSSRFFSSNLWFSVITTPILIYMVIAMFRVFFYFRDKFKFQKALLRKLPKTTKLWRRLNLWKRRLLFYGSAVGPALITLYVFVIIFILILLSFSD